MSKKLRKKEIRKEKNQKQVREPVPLYGNPGSSTKTHTGTGFPRLGTGFQGILPKSRTKNAQQEPVPPNWEPGSRAFCPGQGNNTRQEPVPPNWEPGSRAFCPSSKPTTYSRNRFPQTGN